jgi:hypothetical protein
MKTENFDHTYESAISAIGTIEDEGYRAALIEAAILHRVRLQLGRNDPASELAMSLRRDAAAAMTTSATDHPDLAGAYGWSGRH